MNCRRLRPTLETTFDFRHLNRRNGCFVSVRLVSGDKESFVPSLPALSLPINSLCNSRRETRMSEMKAAIARHDTAWKSFELGFLGIIKIDHHRYCNSVTLLRAAKIIYQKNLLCFANFLHIQIMN